MSYSVNYEFTLDSDFSDNNFQFADRIKIRYSVAFRGAKEKELQFSVSHRGKLSLQFFH